MTEFDVEEFAKGEPDKNSPSQCQTCRRYPKHAKLIRDFLEIKADPKRGSKMPLRALWRELCKHGYGLGVTAFQKHVANCEAELYGRIEH